MFLCIGFFEDFRCVTGARCISVCCLTPSLLFPMMHQWEAVCASAFCHSHLKAYTRVNVKGGVWLCLCQSASAPFYSQLHFLQHQVFD